MGTGVTLWKEPPEQCDLIDELIPSIFVLLLDCVDGVPVWYTLTTNLRRKAETSLE